MASNMLDPRIQDAWGKVTIPKSIQKRWNLFKLLEYGPDTLLFKHRDPNSNEWTDNVVFWIKAWDYNRTSQSDRRSLGVVLKGDEAERLTDTDIERLLQCAVNGFEQKSSHLDEGGMLAVPLSLEEIGFSFAD